jgi:hypothetical protein
MSSPDKISTPEQIKSYVVIAAILIIIVAVFYLLNTLMVGYNLYFTDFKSKNIEFATALAIGLAIMSLPYFFIGIGLILKLKFARFLAILMGFVLLFAIPVGTPLGIYMLWLFLYKNTDSYFGENPVSDLRIYSEDD